MSLERRHNVDRAATSLACQGELVERIKSLLVSNYWDQDMTWWTKPQWKMFQSQGAAVPYFQSLLCFLGLMCLFVDFIFPQTKFTAVSWVESAAFLWFPGHFVGPFLLFHAVIQQQDFISVPFAIYLQPPVSTSSQAAPPPVLISSGPLKGVFWFFFSPPTQPCFSLSWSSVSYLKEASLLFCSPSIAARSDRQLSDLLGV